MIITCEACAARFRLDDHYIQPTGTKVRCARCRHVFTAFRESEPEAPQPVSQDTQQDDVPHLEDAHKPPEAKDVSESASSFSPFALPDLPPLPVLTTPPEDLSPNPDIPALDLDDIRPAKTTQGEEEPTSSEHRTSREEPVLEDFDLDSVLKTPPEDSRALEEGFDPDFMSEAEKTGARASLEDLDLDLKQAPDQNFELDFHLDEDPIPKKEVSDDLDLSFDLDETPDTETSTRTEELELDFSLDEEKPQKDSTDDFSLDLDFDLDFKEPQSASSEDLDLDLHLDLEGDASKQKDFLEDLDLDLDFESAPAAPASEKTLDDFDLQLDMDDHDLQGKSASKDFRLELDTASSGQEKPSDDFELDLDLDLGETKPPTPSEKPQPSLAHAIIASPEKPDADSGEEEKPSQELLGQNLKKSQSLRFILLILLLLLLMGAGIFGGILYLQKNQISLPFIGPPPSRTAVPEVQDPGNLRIHTLAVGHSFVNHESAGRLLIISGKVRNDYPHTRHHIHLRARLFTGESPAATRMVYAGNTLPEMELIRMPMAAIEKELGKKSGDRAINENIVQGKEIPFMFVFSDLPQGLSGFEIDVLRSSPVLQP
jgi:predicted Zn finger-like uncharacterized protein